MLIVINVYHLQQPLCKNSIWDIDMLRLYVSIYTFRLIQIDYNKLCNCNVIDIYFLPASSRFVLIV